MSRRPDPYKAFLRECYAEALAAGEVPIGRGEKPMGFIAWMKHVNAVLIADNHGWDDKSRRRTLPLSALMPGEGSRSIHEPRLVPIVPDVTKPVAPRKADYRGWIVPEHDTREKAA